MVNKADITVVLDRSASMEAMQGEAIHAFNDFVMEQRTVTGSAKMSLVQFNHQTEWTCVGVPIESVGELNRRDYRPNGNTAMLDAIGETIMVTRRRLKDESEQPMVIIVVITDGWENSSMEFTAPGVRSLISESESRDDWRFVFLASDLSSVRDGVEMGFQPDRAIAMGLGGANYCDGVGLVSKKISEARLYRGRSGLDFTEKERRAQRGDV